jgi:hypothetical protein
LKSRDIVFGDHMRRDKDFSAGQTPDTALLSRRSVAKTDDVKQQTRIA